MKTRLKFISLILLSISLLFFSSCDITDIADIIDIHIYNDDGITVHFVDVGQADCEIVECGGEVLIIDGGNAADSSLVVSYLRSLGIDTIEYMIATHAHEDHIGGLAGPLSVMTVKTVFAPSAPANTKAYKNFVKGVENQGIEITHPYAGYEFLLGDATVKFLGTTDENYDDLNNTSLVCRVVYGENRFLFTGDAERERENDILETGEDISADVLKVGHHGSSSSTSYRFLREVMPRYAIIEVGKNNDYNHPHKETLSRLRDADTEVYRTDKYGNIVIHGDGKSLKITTEK